MRSMLILAVAAFSALVAAAPAPEPIDYLMSLEPSSFGLPYDDDPNSVKKRAVFTTRNLHKRTDTPDNTCGGTNAYICDGWEAAGPCCGISNTCGQGNDYCSGGCQPEFGFCVEPTLQIQLDAEGGDVLWDPVTDNVFEAEIGDGMIVFGTAPTNGWPTK